MPEEPNELLAAEEAHGSSFRRYVIRVTGGRSLLRFAWQGAILNACAWAPTVFGVVLRGLVYRTILGGIGSKCFIERNVRLTVPRNMCFGDRVFLGDGCYLDADEPEGQIEIGSDVHLCRNITIRTGKGKLVVGSNTYIGPSTMLYAHGGLDIGADCLFGGHVQVVTGGHRFDDPDRLIRLQGWEPKRVVIEDDVWVGGGALVLGGVTIGRGTVVGAGAVVTHDLPPYSVAAGVPAKVIKSRKPGESA